MTAVEVEVVVLELHIRSGGGDAGNGSSQQLANMNLSALWQQ